MPEQIRLRRITEDDIMAIPDHVGDSMSKEYRLGLHQQLVEEHNANRNTSGDPGFSCKLISGEKGVGKSNITSMLAMDYFRKGFHVVSNMSLLYGFHIESAVDILTFSQVLPQRLVLVLDEIHALLSRYRQGATGQMEFIQGLAGLRKARIHLIGATSQEEEVANNFLRECDWIYYPKRRKRYPQMGQGVGHYPGWCHLRMEAVGPRPLEGQTVGERFGITKGKSKAKRRLIRGITPANIYQAAALQSSFAGLPKGKSVGTHVMAGDVREALDNADVIEFDRIEEGAEEAPDDAQAKADFSELKKHDEAVLTAIWDGFDKAGIASQPRFSMNYAMFQLGMRGFEFTQGEVEETLQRWVNYKPGSDIETKKIEALFVRPTQ